MPVRRDSSIPLAPALSVFAVLVLAPLCTTSALAQSTPNATAPRLAFDVPAASLDQALATIARTSGVIVLFEPGLVAHKTSADVKGMFSAHDAMREALRGTGLELVANPDGSFGLAPSTPVATPTPDAPSDQAALPSVTVMAKGLGADFGYRDRGFAAASTRSATRTDTALSNIPQAIQIVTKDVMKSQQAQSVPDALRYLSAADTRPMPISKATYPPFIRGFEAHLQTNGFEDFNTEHPLGIPVVGIERIEVLKGANFVIATGYVQLGGIINVVTKRPQAEPVRELTWETGTHGHQRTSLNLAGPLSDDKALSFRTVLSVTRDARTYDGYDGDREFYLAPSLGWRHGGTSVVVGMSYQWNRAPQRYTQYALLSPRGAGPDQVDSPRGRKDDSARNWNATLFYDLEQQLGSDWAFLSKFRYARGGDSFLNSGCVPQGPATYACAPYGGKRNAFGWHIENGVRGRFHTGPLAHTFLVGMNHRNESSEGGLNYGNDQRTDAQIVPRPPSAYLSRLRFSDLASVAGPPRVNDPYVFTSSNVFVQDQVAWGPWHVLANIGYAQSKVRTSPLQQDTSGQQRDAFQPRSEPFYNFGVAYRLNDATTVYANAMRRSNPGQIHADATLDGGARGLVIIPPPTGQSRELGVKLDLLDDRLSVTGSVFRAEELNVLRDATPPGAPAGMKDYVLLPFSRSRGLELDIDGRLAPGWHLMASYSYTRFTIAPPARGQPELSQIPHHKLGVWTTYNFQNEAWRNWSVGAGVTARSGYKAAVYGADAQGNAQTYRLGGQAQTDLSISYKSKAWSTTLGIKNLFNRRLFHPFASGGGVYVQPYRTLLLTSTYSF
jgi:iron complex outermembrane receptor protein